MPGPGTIPLPAPYPEFAAPGPVVAMRSDEGLLHVTAGPNERENPEGERRRSHGCPLNPFCHRMAPGFWMS